ncbi:MAG: type III-A CRISPR-associated RAMP protein Csm3 [Halothiobacillaceae bacterium]
MKLTAIRKFTGKLELITGLHIGSGNNEMHIGGTDNPVLKNPITQEPYIPGSSLKGKIRSLLEWKLGVVSLTEGKPLGFRDIGRVPAADQDAAKTLLKLFGGAPEGPNQDMKLVEEIGPTRLAFWDCPLSRAWVDQMSRRNLLLTETKMENMIDRIRGVAEHPRNTERVPAGAVFDFALTVRIHDGENLLDMVFEGLKLLELAGLGGSVSRGYGKVKFTALKLDDEDALPRLNAVNLAAMA